MVDSFSASQRGRRIAARGRGADGMKRIRMFVFAVALTLGAAGCGSDDPIYVDYIGVWTSTCASNSGSEGTLTLTINDDDTFSFSIVTSLGGYVGGNDLTPLWEKGSLTWTETTSDESKNFSATFTSGSEGEFSYDSTSVSWAPCSGTMTR